MSDEAFARALNWRQLSPDDREREYSPSSCVNNELDPFLDEYAAQSAASRRWCERNGFAVDTLSYGQLATQTTDIVTPGTAQAPLVVFIHGGYWQALSKLDSFGPAQDFVSRGCAFATVDYTLAPAASLDQIVAECRVALACIHEQASRFGVDPDRMIVAGSSAGAHLAAMVALDTARQWRPAGLVLLSGIYELAPLLGTTINEALKLNVADAHRNSPSRLPIPRSMPSVVAWGDNETRQFKEQSRLFANRLAEAGAMPAIVEALHRNHFDILDDLGDTTSDLGRAVAALIDSTRRNHAEL